MRRPVTSFVGVIFVVGGLSACGVGEAIVDPQQEVGDSSEAGLVTDVQHRLPTGTLATPSQWSSSTGGSKYGDVDDPVATPDDAASYIYKRDGNGSQAFSIAAFALTDVASIAKVTLTVRHARTPGSVLAIEPMLKVGTVLGHSGRAAPTRTWPGDAWVTTRFVWSANPVTGLPWTQGEVQTQLNGFGFSLGGSSAGEEVRVTQAYLSVSYVKNTGPSFTHFVTANGSGTSLCTQAEPCSITQAMRIAATATMPCGSVVRLSAGYYVQPALEFPSTRSCAAGTHVKLIGEPGTIFTGTRFRPNPAAFTATPGLDSVYEMQWDETVDYDGRGPMRVGHAAQRNPTVWTPIVVEDRQMTTNPPFSVPARKFDLITPVTFSGRRNLDDVWHHQCTLWNDSANNKVYVHMCHHGAPTQADDLYFGASTWGSITVSGDGLWLEGIELNNVSAAGSVRVNFGADRTVIKNVKVRAGNMVLWGTNTLAEDIDISEHIFQNPDEPTNINQCYDAATGIGGATARSCFNAFGSGHALSVGSDNNPTASYGQVVRRAYVHRSWNAGSLHGANTLEHSTFWGFANHAMGMGASHGRTSVGSVLRNNIISNSQDSLFIRANFDGMIIENNLFKNGVLITESLNGTCYDGVCVPTTSWTFRRNIAVGATTDDFVTLNADPADIDCNLYVDTDPDSALFRNLDIPTIAGIGARTFYSFATFQAGTPFDDHGAVYTSWSDPALFAGRGAAGPGPAGTESINYRPASTASPQLNMPGCGYVGPYPAP